MARVILLDAGLIGLACSPRSPQLVAFEHWLEGRVLDGVEVVIPDVARFEVRRELLRLRATTKLDRLNRFCVRFAAGHVTPEA